MSEIYYIRLSNNDGDWFYREPRRWSDSFRDAKVFSSRSMVDHTADVVRASLRSQSVFGRIKVITSREV